MPPTSILDAAASSALRTFLRDAAAARSRGDTTDEARCFDAAAKLQPLDGTSLDALITGLRAQQRHEKAIGFAAIIAQLASISHLSGALGQRTWVLLDVNPHWVWLLGRSDSPWYPSATLYRQPRFGEWEPALQAVSRDLRALAAQHHGA